MSFWAGRRLRRRADRPLLRGRRSRPVAGGGLRRSLCPPRPPPKARPRRWRLVLKVLRSWLRDFAPFSGDPVALGDVLSAHGTPGASMGRVGAGLDVSVAAKVSETRPTEGATKVQQVHLDAGRPEGRRVGKKS